MHQFLYNNATTVPINDQIYEIEIHQNNKKSIISFNSISTIILMYKIPLRTVNLKTTCIQDCNVAQSVCSTSDPIVVLQNSVGV